jgi:hypothetical protein
MFSKTKKRKMPKQSNMRQKFFKGATDFTLCWLSTVGHAPYQLSVYHISSMTSLEKTHFFYCFLFQMNVSWKRAFKLGMCAQVHFTHSVLGPCLAWPYAGYVRSAMLSVSSYAVDQSYCLEDIFLCLLSPLTLRIFLPLNPYKSLICEESFFFFFCILLLCFILLLLHSTCWKVESWGFFFFLIFTFLSANYV